MQDQDTQDPIVLEARQVSKTVPSPEGSLTILADVSLAVRAGESLAIVGPSGAGKSTLLALLAGLDTPSTGRVLIAGIDLTALDEDGRAALRGRHVGFVFQSFHLIPSLTALENVMLPLELAGRADARGVASEALARVGLTPRLTHYPKQLSGGEQQRVAIARAFVTHPDVRLPLPDERAVLDRMPGSSVLDVGCGFCDLYDFLDKRGWQGRYTGIDIVPGLLEVAKQRHPGLDVRECDITDDSAPLDEYDFVISSGALNASLPSGGNEVHIELALRTMFLRSRLATCVDFLSTYVDFQKPGAYHTDPGWALAAAKRLTRRVLLRHDYMPYEFSIFLFRDDAISERKVFRAFERELTTGM